MHILAYICEYSLIWKIRLLYITDEDIKEREPLHSAVKKENLEMVELLLEHGADPGYQVWSVHLCHI